VNGLHQALIEVHRQGKTVVVIIDEAQSMTLQTLENLRILSNLMTTTDKLIQIVLVGQTQFERLLEMNDLGQHKQRVVVHSKIVPLSAEESYVYIEHRLSVAGLSNSAIFSKEALDTIVKEANGIPRRLNAVCEQALISGFRYQKNPVTVRIAREVVSDFTSKQKQPTVRKWKVAALVGVTVLLAFLAVFAVSSYRNTVTHTTERAGLEQTTKSESAESRPLRPTEPEVPVKVESAPEPANEAGQKPTVAAPPYARRVVRSGETLVGLIREVYHIGPDSLPDDSLIDLVRRYNPAILDPNRILAGSVILFPEPPKGTRQSS
jgi:general secretion pathway protein A